MKTDQHNTDPNDFTSNKLQTDNINAKMKEKYNW